MALQCGIVGLPNVGKSTLFNCLSNAKAQSANFPFCTIEPNLGTINVPDPRLERLAGIVNPQNVVPTTVEIVDIAGLVKGASTTPVLVSPPAVHQKQRLSPSQHIARSAAVGASAQPIHSLSAQPKTAAVRRGSTSKDR